ncbi:unnamed protein product, partial [marine sediment metagenome]
MRNSHALKLPPPELAYSPKSGEKGILSGIFSSLGVTQHAQTKVIYLPLIPLYKPIKARANS